MFLVEEFEDSEFVKMLLNGMKKDLAKKIKVELFD